MSGYWHIFKDTQNSCLQAQTRFETIVSLADFDQKLRYLIFQGLEQIELHLRQSISLRFSQRYGSFGYLDSTNFHPRFQHSNFLGHIQREINRSRTKEPFLVHFENNYHNFPSIPIWMMVEVITFGNLSHFYRGLKSTEQQPIAQEYGLSQYPRTLQRWLHSFNYIRNIVAHHGRLWNRHIAIAPPVPSFLQNQGINQQRIFLIIVIMKYLLDHIESSNAWKTEILNLFSEFENEQPSRRILTGAPSHWRTLLL